ncbi:putative ankyrin repeat-containing protein-like isoform 2 [Capsicum annuum]|nr:putative ankyrin repeat-containing protein-like isoform 2 [Capsicum annuum]KAF3654627.1 putative ankyrin repeat-containing protein-like isoform 2 [Capsicum annuum]
MDPILYSAAMRGNIGDANFLLADHLKRDEENGYQVTPKGNTVLHVAALYGHSHFAAEVLKITPAMLCCQNKKNETALHIAANEGHTEVVRVLLACVEDHNTNDKLTIMTDASGDTALHKAVRSQHLDVVKLLVKEGSEFEFPPNHPQETPLYLAAESGFHEALINILESCKKPTYAAGPSNRTPLHAAVIHEHKDCIRSRWRWNKALCEQPDLWGWNSLHYAVKFGLEDVVSDMLGWKKSLVYLPAGSENDWATAIHIAASEGDVNMINELLNHCPDCWDMLNSNNQNALHVAILNNKDKLVRVILDSGKCDSLVDELDSDGNTPLHLLAASDNHEKLVRDLCSIGRFGKRDFEVKRKNEYMPLREDDHDKARKANQTEVESIMKSAQIHIVVATLIMTVTFAAGITLPGGFESDPDNHNKGMAILIRKTTFRAFVVSDAIAFTCSAVAIFIYFFMADESRPPSRLEIVSKLYDLAGIFQCLSMLAVVVAFATVMIGVRGGSEYFPKLLKDWWKKLAILLHISY